jgi:hypothetical protein
VEAFGTSKANRARRLAVNAWRVLLTLSPGKRS